MKRRNVLKTIGGSLIALPAVAQGRSEEVQIDDSGGPLGEYSLTDVTTRNAWWHPKEYGYIITANYDSEAFDELNYYPYEGANIQLTLLNDSGKICDQEPYNVTGGSNELAVWTTRRDASRIEIDDFPGRIYR